MRRTRTITISASAAGALLLLHIAYRAFADIGTLMSDVADGLPFYIGAAALVGGGYWLTRSRQRAMIAVCMLGVGVFVGAAFAYKWTIDNQRARVEDYERSRVAAEKDAAEFERCRGNAVRQARLNDQKRREQEITRPGPRNDKFSEEMFLIDMWRASGKKC